MPQVLWETSPPMTDTEFLQFCAGREDLDIEVNSRGEFEISPNSGFISGQKNGEITYQLIHWARVDRRGIVTDSSTLFRLPNGAKRSPDAAWTERSSVAPYLASKQMQVFPICPEFVIELRSPTDDLARLQEKMHEWIINGAQLAWLVDPIGKTTTVYRPGAAPEVVADLVVRGEGPVQGFELHLAEIYE
ncbi:MAG: Uma2 family endonuclease [Acidobacteria bacterium]|nr:Uma2 family endonuclease [Acidobacteriota bacterium]